MQVRGGIYNETVSINSSGSEAGGYITFQTYPGEIAALDGSGFASAAGDIAFTIENQNYIIVNQFRNPQLQDRPVWRHADGYLCHRRSASHSNSK